MQPIRTAIVDDEPDARDGIRELLTKDADIVVVGEARTGREAVALIHDARPELVFLDVHMPELDGFGALAAVQASAMPLVIFVTAYDEHALRAFEVNALDYLLKPFSDERFAEALHRAKEQVRQRRIGEISPQLVELLSAEPSSRSADHTATTSADLPADERYLDRVMVRTAKGSVFLRTDDIDWIEADDYYARLHVGGRSYLIRQTMRHLEKRLDPRRFVRVHRSAIVNIDRVQTLQPYFRGTHVLTLRDGTQVTMSRSRRANLEKVVGWRI
ncbi:MAG TPA: LytTR family DNA-binding domain-containing protein [Gemmatimonadaceae bacterium]|nr:LytTR family DNA-binding domain-containing protein [Gemmatimonadaceae bacterium]